MINLDEIAYIGNGYDVNFRIRRLVPDNRPPFYVLWKYQNWNLHKQSMEFYREKYNEFFNILMEKVND